MGPHTPELCGIKWKPDLHQSTFLLGSFPYPLLLLLLPASFFLDTTPGNTESSYQALLLGNLTQDKE